MRTRTMMRTGTLLAAAGVGLAVAGRRRLAHPEADLTGEVALVTGGSRGLGFLLARELARAGCSVAICARDTAELERARDGLMCEGAPVMALRCDVSDRVQVNRMVAAVTEAFGRVDILVNNAGIIQVGPLSAMTVEDFEAAMGVMYWGVLYPTLAVLPQMRQRRHGRIVTISSIGGTVSVPHLLPYGSAKFAATGFSEGLRAELAGEGISVSTIVPGLMRTGSYLNATFKGRKPGEFTWFGLGSALPLVSMDAERAARQIVRAIRRGEAQRALTVPATLLAAAHGLFPGLVADALGLANRLILPPDGAAADGADPGASVQEGSPSALRDLLTTWGRDAAERFHEVGKH